LGHPFYATKTHLAKKIKSLVRRSAMSALLKHMFDGFAPIASPGLTAALKGRIIRSASYAEQLLSTT
jgi:hypothetical protein